MDSACGFGADKTATKLSPEEDHVMEETKEESRKQSVETVSVEIQTDPITDGELLSLQQQKM